MRRDRLYIMTGGSEKTFCYPGCDCESRVIAPPPPGSRHVRRIDRRAYHAPLSPLNATGEGIHGEAAANLCVGHPRVATFIPCHSCIVVATGSDARFGGLGPFAGPQRSLSGGVTSSRRGHIRYERIYYYKGPGPHCNTRLTGASVIVCDFCHRFRDKSLPRRGPRGACSGARRAITPDRHETLCSALLAQRDGVLYSVPRRITRR